jgi:hypothetical protein
LANYAKVEMRLTATLYQFTDKNRQMNALPGIKAGEGLISRSPNVITQRLPV